jgi:hypothetical protein
VGAILDAAVRGHDFAIQIDPQPITIHRKQRVVQGSAFRTDESDIGPFTVKIYVKSSNATPRQVVTLAGQEETLPEYGMIGYGGGLYGTSPAKVDLDVMYGPTVVDEFTDPDRGRMRVVGVTVMRTEGKVFGYDVDLQVIRG